MMIVAIPYGQRRRHRLTFHHLLMLQSLLKQTPNIVHTSEMSVAFKQHCHQHQSVVANSSPICCVIVEEYAAITGSDLPPPTHTHTTTKKILSAAATLKVLLQPSTANFLLLETQSRCLQKSPRTAH